MHLFSRHGRLENTRIYSLCQLGTAFLAINSFLFKSLLNQQMNCFDIPGWGVRKFYWPLSCDRLLHTRCRGLAHWTFWSSLHARFSVFQDNGWIQNQQSQLFKSQMFLNTKQNYLHEFIQVQAITQKLINYNNNQMLLVGNNKLVLLAQSSIMLIKY